MPEYTVNWECRVHGSSTITARDEDDAKQQFEMSQEGVELENIHELYPTDASVTSVEYFQDSAEDEDD